MLQFEYFQVGKMPKRRESADRLRKVYREYARIKFKKYRNQFPRLRESEIVNKIFQEWESLDEEAKNNIQVEFLERGGPMFLAASSSSSRKRKEQEAKKKALNSDFADSGRSKSKKKKSSPKTRTFEGKSSERRQTIKAQAEQARDTSDFKNSQEGKKSGKKSTPDKESSSQLRYLDKTKRISKSSRTKRKELIKHKREQEMTFKKYYYNKLATQHPRWDKNQLTTIVKLLWIKRKRAKQMKQGFPKKGLSGRQMYRRTKESEGFLKEQVKQMWKALPHESKRYWQILGRGKLHRSGKTSGKHIKKVLNSGASKENVPTNSQANFGWMDRQII